MKTNISAHHSLPVPLARSDAMRHHKTGLSRILVPVDFSATTPTALDMALSLVKPDGGGLWLLHVLLLPECGMAGDGPCEPDEGEN